MTQGSLDNNCLKCGKTFYNESSWFKMQKFCSRECANQFRQNKPSISPKTTFKKGNKPPFHPIGCKCFRCDPIRGEKHHKYKGGDLSKICIICQKSFLVDRYRINAKTCSRVCDIASRKTEEFRMKLSMIQRNKIPFNIQSRNDELRKFTSRLRRSYRYNIWREEVFKQDNFTCQNPKCGKRGGTDLIVDHIRPFISLLISNNITSHEEALRCEELWKVSNGRVLCKKCHYKTATFGSKVHKLLANQSTTTISNYNIIKNYYSF